MPDRFVSAKGKKMIRQYVCLKFITATNYVDAKEGGYARMESIPGGVTAVFG